MEISWVFTSIDHLHASIVSAGLGKFGPLRFIILSYPVRFFLGDIKGPGGGSSGVHPVPLPGFARPWA